MLNQIKSKALIAVLLALFLTVSIANAQNAQSADYKLKSTLMARELPYRVALPKNYEADKTTRYPVIYLLHGLTGHYNNWGDSAKIVKYLEPFNFIVVMAEGDNGWYTDSATVPNDKYESYIIKELIPEIDKNFRTNSTRNGRIIAGLSMGGYGSLKFGLKYPETFTLVGSFSGALAAASWSEKTLGKGWAALIDSIMSVYGEDGSQNRKENDIYQLVKNASPEQIKALPFIYLDSGTEDALVFQQNRDFSNELLLKKIPHEYRERPGVHNWEYWEAQIQEFLRLSERHLKKLESSKSIPAKA